MTALQDAHAKTIIATVASDSSIPSSLRQRAAIICIETAIVESGLTIYANPNVPESMNLPHEAVGSDHASVGIFQQQVPSWGTAADCMDPARSTLKFLHGAGTNPGLLTLPGYRFSYVGYSNASSWSQIPTGSAAQAVQVSAYPTRYQQVEAQATSLVNTFWPTTTTDWFDMATQADLQKAIQTELGFYLPRLVGLLRKGTTNQAFTPTNSGSLIDGKGVDGEVADLKALVQSLATEIEAIKAKVGA